MGNSSSSSRQTDIAKLESHFDAHHVEALRNLADSILVRGSHNQQTRILNVDSALAKWKSYPDAKLVVDGLQRLLSHVSDNRLPLEFPLNSSPPLSAHQEDGLYAFNKVVSLVLLGSSEDKAVALRLFLPQEGFSSIRDWLRPVVHAELHALSLKLEMSYQGVTNAFMDRVLSGKPCDDADSVSISPLKPSDDRFIEWLSSNAVISTFVSNFFTRMFLHYSDGIKLTNTPPLVLEKEIRQQLWPPIMARKLTNSLVTSEHIWFLQFHLPATCSTKWTALYISHQDGHSWNYFSRAITQAGHLLLIIRTTNDDIIGAYSSTDWVQGPNFFGTSDCFIFTLAPELQMFRATGYSDHYQYFQCGTSTMPNGLGMGGQLDHFGLYISSDFQTGHSHSNSTFSNPNLAGEHFTIRDVEVWQVREPVRKIYGDEVVGEISGVNSRAQVLDFLDMAGVQTFSRTAGIPHEPE